MADDQAFVDEARPALEAAGHLVSVSSREASAPALAGIRPDVVVADVAQPGVDGFDLLRDLREMPEGRSVPVILLTAGADDDVLTGLRLGADDCVAKPLSASELVARVQTKMARPSVPADMIGHDRRTGLAAEKNLVQEADRELVRGRRAARPGALAVIALQEAPRLVDRFGPRASVELAEQLAAMFGDEPHSLQRLGVDQAGRLLALLPETADEDVEQRLAVLGAQVGATRLTVAGEQARVTPVIGWVRFAEAGSGAELLARATRASEAAALHLDLLPVPWTPDLEPREPKTRLRGTARLMALLSHLRLPAQVGATFALGMGVPFLVYLTLGHFGLDVISGPAYWVILAALLLTATMIWIEGLFALDPQQPPDEPGAPYPAASAIIAAYLPNEAATILETVEAFQRLDYPGPLQILVAYNNPNPMAVEDDLREIARQDPRVVPLRVPNSTSKAQNVNAAMSHVTGEFVGMFDADHHPDPGSFRRAWRWLSNGWDVVQGHCVIRNGDASAVAQMVAIEFETIYAVSHPGRANLHGFGIFGGSNGYWRTELLARTRMHGSMLTEDIDSTLRILDAGAKIASDPALISRELAPTTWHALWKQRTRWAQGWFQVSRKHLARTWRSSQLSARQKVGLSFLLGWREIYAWMSLQMIPLLAYTAYRMGGVTKLRWDASALVLATAFTLAVGPVQTLFAKRLAAPELRERSGWFWRYLFVSSIFYTEWKNVVARVAQIKELAGERQWHVTPRAADRTP